VLFVSIMLFFVLFMCKRVLYCCLRVSTKLQLNVSYHHIISCHISYHNWMTFVKKAKTCGLWDGAV